MFFLEFIYYMYREKIVKYKLRGNMEADFSFENLGKNSVRPKGDWGNEKVPGFYGFAFLFLHKS